MRGKECHPEPAQRQAKDLKECIRRASTLKYNTMKFISLILITILSLFILPSTIRGVDVKDIIDRVDKLYRSRSSYAEVEMIVKSPHWQRTLRMKVWTEGLEKTLIYITSPKKDRGIATLRIGSEMWNYFPRINKVMKVPPSMMMGSWMGSDFTNDDLVKESSLLRDYDHKLINPEGADPNLYYIELTPREETPTVWGRIVIAIRKSDYLPVTEEYYDEKGNKIRVLRFSEIRQFSSRKIPSRLDMIPLNKEGHMTTVIYKRIDFDIDIDKDIFTLRNLKKRH